MDKKKLLPILPAVLFVALVAIVFTIMGSIPYDRPSTTASNSFGNLANGGYVSDAGSMLYYVDGKGVLRCQSDANNYYIDEGASYLSPYQNGIVYKSESGEIKYSGYNGEGKRIIAENARDMMVVGNWIFYSDNDGMMHKYWLKTSKHYDINLKVNQFMVSGTAIVYTDDEGYMYTARTDGSEVEPFMAEKVDRFMRHDSYMFYLSGGKLYSVTSNNTAQKHTYCEAEIFNLSSDGILYFIKDGALHTMNIKEEEQTVTVVESENGVANRGIFCADNRVYFYDLNGALVSCLKDGSEMLTY